jgi:hypothetical protein
MRRTEKKFCCSGSQSSPINTVVIIQRHPEN